MGSILSLLGGKFGIFILIAVGLLLLGSMGYGAYQHQRAERYQAEVETKEAELKSKQRDVDILVGVTKNKDETIANQRETLTKWQEYATKKEAEVQLAAETARSNSKVLAEYNRQLRDLRSRDDALPECRKFMATDLALVCPDTARVLRDRAGRNDRTD